MFQRRFPRRARLLSLLGTLWLTGVYGSVVVAMAVLGASLSPYPLGTPQYAPPTRIYSSDGRVLAKLYEHYYVPTPLHAIPAHTVHAVLAAEDARFFQHRGLDGRGIARALWVDLRTRSFAQGGSTITQQLVRMELLDDRRTISRKVQEAVLALRIERAHTKSEILERYLNTVYFGGGAYGIGAAAEVYFGKTPRALSPAESALLAGLIRAPSEGNPRRHLPEALRRQRLTLAQMERHGWLSPAQRDAAVRARITLRARAANAWTSPYAVEAVRKELIARYGRAAIYHSGMTVYTTINARMQRAAERALAQAIRAGSGRRVGNGALVAVEPQTGAIRALVGGKDFWHSPFNRATQAHRQPGSTFKVFVYQAALDHGHLLSDPALDAPVTVGGWSPDNYGGRYHGTVTLEMALARSLNSVAVRMTSELSPFTVAAAARDAGISSHLLPNMTIALGTSEVTPLEMAHAFATFANGGRAVEPSLIKEIRRGRTVLYRHVPIAQQRVSPVTAFLLTQGLRTVITAGTGRRASIGRPAAGKTGTSNEYRDAWFVGYTPTLSTAVWLGNDNRRPMAGVAGGNLPAQAWAAFMRDALRGQPARDFVAPAGVVPVQVCRASGKLALPVCPTRVVYYPEDRVPTERCTLHFWVTRTVCAVTGQLPNPTCPKTTKKYPYDATPSAICTVDHRPVPPWPGSDPASPQPATPIPAPAPTSPAPAPTPSAPQPEVNPPAVSPTPAATDAPDETPAQPETPAVPDPGVEDPPPPNMDPQDALPDWWHGLRRWWHFLFG